MNRSQLGARLDALAFKASIIGEACRIMESLSEYAESLGLDVKRVKAFDTYISGELADNETELAATKQAYEEITK